MIKGFYIDKSGSVNEIQDGAVVFIDGYDTAPDYEDPWEYEGCEDSWEDDYDFPWDENGESFEDWLEEVL